MEDNKEPNEETYAAMEEAEQMLKDPNTKRFESVDELFKELDDKVEIVKDPYEGGFVVRFPGLPGCITCGETLQSALKNAKDAKEAWLEAEREEKEKKYNSFIVFLKYVMQDIGTDSFFKSIYLDTFQRVLEIIDDFETTEQTNLFLISIYKLIKSKFNPIWFDTSEACDILHISSEKENANEKVLKEFYSLREKASYTLFEEEKPIIKTICCDKNDKNIFIILFDMDFELMLSYIREEFSKILEND